MKRVLVTGANGQLGQSIMSISGNQPNLEFVFAKREDLDITNERDVMSFFKKHTPDYCINCAAYTQVDKAEADSDRCFEVNVSGVQNLTLACTENECILIHISSDFVFDGSSSVPYKETVAPSPINVYGDSKYEAEQVVVNLMEKYFIIRTAWVYSEFGKNFVKTIIRLAREIDEIKVVNDQFGSPTYASDLANFALSLIKSESDEYGIYHFTNQGITTWYEFAKEILKQYKSEVKVFPINSEEYKLAAKRPMNSALDLTKTIETFNIEIPAWRESLKNCINQIQSL